MDELRGGWVALLIVLVFVFLGLVGWGVAAIERALDWSLDDLPFALTLVVGLLLIGIVLAIAGLLAMAFTLGLRQIFEDAREKRGN